MSDAVVRAGLSCSATSFSEGCSTALDSVSVSDDIFSFFSSFEFCATFVAVRLPSAEKLGAVDFSSDGASADRSGNGAAGDCVNSGVGCCTGGLLAADNDLEGIPVSTVFCTFSFTVVTSSVSGLSSVPCSVEDCSSAFGFGIAGACGLGSDGVGGVVPECTPVTEKIFF
ncbi:hypothetical protein TcBrA4_0031480 [Trypanosoma cruzi]|nr:hypothetical protein TcBrA4_0031480 [Trypanosoma cruzi]